MSDNNTIDILASVNTIFIDVLENDKIMIDYETSAKDIPEWDSLTHIQLIVEIEKKFHIRFLAAEIQSFKNVGEMITGIKLKLEK